jgi:hypothetical protein
VLLTSCLSAQCRFENHAFQTGEKLRYDLYFNWQFVWVKAGRVSMTISPCRQSSYKNDLQCDLLFEGNEKYKSAFTMNDTLVAIYSPDIVPRYFRKGALEGKRYTVDEVNYSYQGGQNHVLLNRWNSKGELQSTRKSSDECLFDMLSLLARARCINTNGLKKDQRITFNLCSGRSVEKETLVYRGKQNVKANDKNTYRCLVLSVLDYKEKKRDKELLRFYVTDDANHVPIRIDFFLRFGTAKAFLSKSEGLRNPVGAIIKSK